MDGSRLFRKAALERLQSPERLDELVAVVAPRSWLALAGVGLLVGLAAVWAFTGTISGVTTAGGALVREGGGIEVTAPQTGTVSRVAVTTGVEVDAGDVLVVVVGPDGGRKPVRSPARGWVSEVLAASGAHVEGGAPLVRVDPVGAPLAAVMLLPVREAGAVAAGMVVAASPAWTDPRQHGLLMGTVEAVGAYPVGEAELGGRLGSAALAHELLREPSVAVTIALTEDPGAANGLTWTQPAGGDLELRAGLTAEISVVTSARRPAALLLPMLDR